MVRQVADRRGVGLRREIDVEFIGIIGQVDRAMAVGGDVTAPAVLRADAPLDAAALATVLGLNLPSPPAAVSSPTEPLVWRRRPRLNPWKL